MPSTASHPPRRRPERNPAGNVRRKTPPQPLVNAINPLVRWLATSRLHRLVDGTVVVLHIIGRKTGRHYDIPVGFVELGDRLLVTTQHRWRTNLRNRPDVDVTIRGSRRTVCLDVDEEPGSIAGTYDEIVRSHGWPDARRRLGLATQSGAAPTRDELEEAARAYHLALLKLSAPPGEPVLTSAR